MYKAIGSKIDLQNRGSSSLSTQYYEAVKDIIDLPGVVKLDEYSQHLSTSRLQHSINVSYYSFRISKLFKLDGKAAARAGLLHDLYYYDYFDTNLSCLEHSSLHSNQALENAKMMTDVTDVEEDIILTHMWPITKKAPSHIEGFVVTFTDKGCTVMEVISKLPKFLKTKIHTKEKFKKKVC